MGSTASRWLSHATSAAGAAPIVWALVGTVGCSNHSSAVHLPSFEDVFSAPSAIQTAARAVVLIGTAGELATGSFISPNGILLTNNHVLGVGICPAEGCYAQITFMDQLHSDPAPTSKTVFVVPLAVDIGLDIAIVQVLPSPGGAPLDTPDYLTLDSRDPAELLGTHINVVGHPDGHLAKWSQGEVVDTSGEWITFSAYALPGNSGSPLLDDYGHMVGILHRGPTAQDLVTGTGIDDYGIGSAASGIVGAMSEPLPGTMWSIVANATADEVVQHEEVYLNAHAETAQVGGVATPVIDLLGAACDAALAVDSYASPDDLTAALAPCYEGESWINCANADGTTTTGSSPSVCPTDPGAWQDRFANAFARIHALNGALSLDLVSSAPASLETTSTAAMTTGATLLQSALDAAQPPLDFSIASYLAAYGISAYAGVDVAAFTKNYAAYPDYGLYGVAITDTILWLSTNNLLDPVTALSLLDALANDPNVVLGAKLYIEDVRYHSGAIQ
jgi:hypothetical protein